MKISVLGAGAMGCLFGAKLSANNDVELINGSQKSVDGINANGVTVSDREGNTLHADLCSRLSGSECSPADLLILFVKNYSTRKALEENRNLIGENTVLLSLQNGMGHEKVAAEFLPQERILIGITNDNSITEAPGKVIHSGKGPTFIGSLCGNEELAKKIVSVFSACGIDCSFSANVRNLVWSKLFVNMAANAATALLGCRSGYLAECASLNGVCRSMIYEAAEVAKADGQIFDPEQVLDHFTQMSAAYSQGKTSMFQDIERLRKTEVDYINGAVAALGREYGIPTPVNDTIIALVHAKEYILGIET